MVLEQAYYTSCETGLRGSKGFQMNAASRGLDTNTLNYLERCGGYLPPLSFPTSPTREELEKFPIALSFYKTQDGFAVISRTKYLGQDYSRRYGNFFTHFLLHKDISTLVKHISPITTWKATFWVEKSIENTELPLIELKEENNICDYSEVKIFLDSDSRLAKLRSFIPCLQMALQSKRRIIIVDSSESVAMWITSVAIALPNSLQEQLTFSTYQKNPYNTDALICGTTKDTDFRFSPGEIAHQFYVFDFENDRFSDPPPATIFSEELINWYNDNTPTEAEQFKNFADWLGIKWEAEDLDHLMNLFKLVSHNELYEDQILNSVRFSIERKLYSIPEIVIPIISVLSERKFDDISCYSIARSLFISTYEFPQIHIELKEDIVRFYVEWVITRILANTSEELIRNEAKFFHEKKIPKKVWVESIDELGLAIENSADIQRLSAILEFSTTLGLLPELEPSIEIMVTRMLLPNIRNEDSQNLLGKLFEEDFSSNFDERIITLIKRQLEFPLAAEELSYLLLRGETLRRIKFIAVSKDDRLLYLLINSFEISRSRDMVERTISFFQDLYVKFKNPPSSNDYNKFFFLAWSAKLLTPEITNKFLHELSDELLASPTFIEMAANGLLNNFDILKPKGNSSVLNLIDEFRNREEILKVKATTNESMSEIYNKILGCLELPNWGKKYLNSKSFSYKLQMVQSALKILPIENVRTRTTIIETAIFDYLNISGDILESTDFIDNLKDLDQTLIYNALDAVLSTINYKKNFCTLAWVHVFIFIYKSPVELSELSGIKEKCENHLRNSYSIISVTNKNQIDFHFSKDILWNKKWELWKREVSASSRFKNIFFR